VADALRALPARRIVAHVADAARRWSDADFPPRVRVTAEIERRLGYSTPVVEYALDRLFFGITPAALEAAIGAELGALDAARPHRRTARLARRVGTRRCSRRDRLQRHDESASRSSRRCSHCARSAR